MGRMGIDKCVDQDVSWRGSSQLSREEGEEADKGVRLGWEIYTLYIYIGRHRKLGENEATL